MEAVSAHMAGKDAKINSIASKMTDDIGKEIPYQIVHGDMQIMPITFIPSSWRKWKLWDMPYIEYSRRSKVKQNLKNV